MLSIPDTKSSSLRRIVRDDTSPSLQFDTVNEAFKDFKSGVSTVVESNLNLLKEVPLHYKLRFEDLKEYLESQIIADLSKDLLFEQAIEISRYARNMYELMDSYFHKIFNFHQELKKQLYSEMFSTSKMFLNSDLPISFVNTIGESLLTEIDYLDIFDKEIRKERFDLIRYRSNRPKFKRVCEKHNLWVKRFDEIREKMERERVKLVWYVDFNNSQGLSEVFKEKTIKVNLLNKSTLYQLILRLQEQTRRMEELNSSKIEFLSFLKQETDEGTKALLRMIQILNQQEGTT
ncbi:MAG: hypothetical protein ACP5LB_03950 [Candidatus Bathyarchaeia archaeon]